MGIIKDCPRGSMEKCTDKYGCVGVCAAVEQFEKEWREESTQKREWVGLTDEELLDIADMAYANDLELLQTLQAKLKEKNHG